MPVPDKEIVKLGLLASDEIVRVPLAELADVGENVTENVMLWPAPRLIGKGNPLRVNAAAELPAELRLIATVPGFVNVSL